MFWSNKLVGANLYAFCNSARAPLVSPGLKPWQMDQTLAKADHLCRDKIVNEHPFNRTTTKFVLILNEFVKISTNSKKFSLKMSERSLLYTNH